MEPVEDVGMFQYIVIAEFDNVNHKNQVKMLDFVHRLRINKLLKAYTSIYRCLQRETPDITSNGIRAERALSQMGNLYI
jgi:hypothetical protein